MPARSDELGRLLRAAQAEQRLPSVVALVLRDGEPAWSDAVGLADVERGEAATLEHQYRLGSITKSFTAAAVLRLRDEGALDLDDRIGDHVDELPHRTPTLRTLLSHTSGLQREAGDMWETMAMPSREELLGWLASSERVLPGGHWHYSNLAYVLLGEVVERVAGTPYTAFVEEAFLRPLGLRRITWRAEAPAATGYLVDPYADAVTVEPSLETAGFTAAGQLWGTAGDVARWAAFLAAPDPAVLAPGSAEEMRTVHAMAEAERWRRGWGLGLSLERRGDRIWAGHGGAMPGFLASVVFRPADRVAVVVLTNSGANAGPDVLALDLGERELELAPTAPTEWRPGEPAPEALAGMLGRWWTEGHELVVRFREGRLEAKLAAAADWLPWAVFEQVDGDAWRTVSGRERGERLEVVRDETGAVVRMRWAGYALTRTPETFG